MNALPFVIKNGFFMLTFCFKKNEGDGPTVYYYRVRKRTALPIVFIVIGVLLCFTLMTVQKRKD